MSAPFLSHVPRSLVLDALKHLDSVCLVRVPGNASIFQCWADKACIYLFSDDRIGASGKVSFYHIKGFGTFSLNFQLDFSMIAYCQTPRRGKGDWILQQVVRFLVYSSG